MQSLELSYWTIFEVQNRQKVINSSTKCLISVKIAILSPYIIPPPLLVNVWLINDMQKHVNWLCLHWKDLYWFEMRVYWACSLVCSESSPKDKAVGLLCFELSSALTIITMPTLATTVCQCNTVSHIGPRRSSFTDPLWIIYVHVSWSQTRMHWL